MRAKLAQERVFKTPDETKKVDFDFSPELASGESISTVADYSVSPTGELTAIPVSDTTRVQVTLAGGLAETAFTGDANTDVLTAAAHALSDDHPVCVIADDSDALPSGLDVDEQYYVVNAAANTFQLALIAGGDPVSLVSSGQGVAAVDYRVTIKVTTSNSQIIVAEGICELRD